MTVADQEITLTRRQREVLSRFIEGASVESIAGSLRLSPWTVRAHLVKCARMLQDEYPTIKPMRRLLIYGSTLLSEGT